MIRAVHRNDQTGLLRVAAILHLLLLRVDQRLHVSSGVLLVLLHLSRLSVAELLVISVHLLAFAFDLPGDLFVYLELTVGFSLCLAALGHEHFPSANVIHGLILMGEQVPLDQRAVSHGHSPTARLQRALASDIRQADL